MLKAKLFLVLISLIQCNNDYSGIIKIAMDKHFEEQTIPTINGDIVYKCYIKERDNIGFGYYMYYGLYKLQNMKNLKLTIYNPETRYLDISGNNKDIVTFSYNTDFPSELDIGNKKLCELFHTTKYIDKKIFAIKYPFKYFGGIPNEIKNNLNKFTFYDNDTVSEIDILFNDNKNKNLNIKLIENNKIEFKDDSHLICLPKDIFSKFKNLLFNQYKEAKYWVDSEWRNMPAYPVFDLTYEQRQFFPEIKFKIRNMSITLNKKDLIYEDSAIYIKGDIREENIHNYLFIKNTPCDNFIFGLKLLEKFDIREYDLEKGEFNLYLDKDKKFIIKEDNINIKLNAYSNSAIPFIILSFFIFTTINLLYNQKNKNFEYNNDNII